MWIESQDKKHLVNIDRIHKHTERHVKRSRVIYSADPICEPVKIEEKEYYTYQILDENGLVLGEYSTEEQRDEVWKELIYALNHIIWLADFVTYHMPEDKKEDGEDEENK